MNKNIKEPKRIAITSPDQREERITQLKHLFPDLFDGEGNLDEKALRALASTDEVATTERFRFEWAGKQQSKRYAFTPSQATLVADPARSVNFDTTQNLIIEGDNLEVLKLLQATYFERVKCIYIDPPYNTGNDFIYPDDYSETKKAYWQKNGTIKDGVKLTALSESDGRKHSAWLNMLQTRLLAARNLLTPDGAVVVHIDENEIHRLRLLMEEVFGPNNFLGEVVWDKRNPKGDSGSVSYQHESILCFAKDKETFKTSTSMMVPKRNAKKMLAKAASLFQQVDKRCVPELVKEALKTLGISDETSTYARKYTLEDANADFQVWLSRQNGLSGGEEMYKYIDKDGEVYRLVSMAWPNNKKAPDNYFIPLMHPVTKKNCPVPAKGWRNPPETMTELLGKNMIVFGADEKTQPQRKYTLRENMDENLASLLYYGGSDDALLADLGIPFDNPKPVDVSRRIIQAFTSKGDIILDFFAGSGTVAHAVIAQNTDDGQNRRYILTQVPEYTSEDHPAYKAGFKTISALCIERVKRAGQRIHEEQPDADIDAGFRVYRLTQSHFPQNLFTPNPDKTEAENMAQLEKHLKANRQQALFGADAFGDVITEIALKNGFGLFYNLEKLKNFTTNTVYHLTGNDKAALLCLDETLKEKTIDLLQSHSDEQLIVSGRALDTTKKWTLQSAFKDNLQTV